MMLTERRQVHCTRVIGGVHPVSIQQPHRPVQLTLAFEGRLHESISSAIPTMNVSECSVGRGCVKTKKKAEIPQ